MSFMSEFRQFIDRGNVMDMAVGVIVGGAFTSVVTSLTDNIINPLINLVTGGGTDFSGLVIPGTAIDFGAFLSSVINFLLIALVVFFLVRGMNRLHKPADEAPAPAPVCPHCLEEVKEGATRCPHCGGEIEGGAHAA